MKAWMKRRGRKTLAIPREAAADVILLSGNVITMDPRKPGAQAIAIKEGRFLKVGNEAEVRALAGRKTEIIALQGRTVAPGFIDSHQHLSQVGTNLLQIDCSPGVCKSIAQIQRAVLKETRRKPRGE